jgi:hypothetical protein
MAQTAPRAMQRSPTLNTLDSGQDAGIANTSPSQGRRGSGRAAELANPSGSAGSPAAANADGAAGMTPPLSAIARKLQAAPRPISQMPGR